MCGILRKFAKLILFGVNIAVWVCGGVIMGVGIALAVDEEAWAWFENISGGMNDDLFAAAVYMMISIGVLLFLVGFLGCCGVCKGNACMLQTYIIIVSIILVLELIGGILAIVFKDSLEEDVQVGMYDDIQNKYNGTNDTSSSVSLSWNNMQTSLKCCGAYNWTDYNNSNWAQGTIDPVPITCCRSTTKISGTEYYTISVAKKTECMTQAGGDPNNPPVDGSELFGQGCYDGLWDWIQKQSNIIIGILIGLGCVQLFGLIGVCCVKNGLEDGDN